MTALNKLTREIDYKIAFYVMGIALLLLGLFVFLVLYSHSYDSGAFVLSGSQFRLADSQGTKGYDGQFAYYIASEPLSAYQYMDEPGKRYQRILYPLIAWTFSFGGLPAMVPWVMVAINIISIAITTGLLALMLNERGVNPWFALVYICYVGVLFSLRADLNEPMAMMLSLAGWYAYQKQWTKRALVCFALAGLAKEIGLIIPFALVMWEFVNRQWRKAAIIIFLSFLPYVILFLFLHLICGNTTRSLLPNWIPFSGIAALQDRAFLAVASIWVLFPIAILLILVFYDVIKRNRASWNMETVMLLINMVLISIMPYQTWEDPLAVLRSAIPFFVVAIIWIAKNRRRFLPYAAALWTPSSIILFLTPGMVI